MQLLLLNGDRLPALRKGAVCELSFSSSVLVKGSSRPAEPSTYQLAMPSRALVALPSAIDIPDSNSLIDSREYSGPRPIAEIEIMGPILVRGSELHRFRLLPVQVLLLDFNDSVPSLNQACTALSEAFETDRKSHTYNAFTSVWLKFDNEIKGPRWRTLQAWMKSAIKANHD